MVKHVDAVFEGGVLVPLEPLDLPENQRVHLTVFDEISANEEVTPQDRRDEVSWLASHSKSYAGRWVALSGKQLIASGADASTVRADARIAGVERPLLVHVPPDGDLPFGGW